MTTIGARFIWQLSLYGAVIVPILQDFHPNDIVNVIEQSDSRMLFVSDHIYKKLTQKVLVILKE